MIVKRHAEAALYQLSSNQRAILDLIRAQGELSRAELATETGLTPGSLTRQIQELLALNLVQEGERRSGHRGQPALPISIRADAAYSVGVSFSLHEIEVVVIDFRGERVAESVDPFAFTSVDELTGQCSRLVASVLGRRGIDASRVLGVGIALPGYFHSDGPVTMDTFDALVLLSGVDLKVFRAAFGRPTWVENNSTAAALAEYYARPDMAAKTLALVNVGYGFSAGFVVDGRLYRGRGGNAGEIGRFYPRGTPRPSALDLVQMLADAGERVTSTAELATLVRTDNAVLRNWVTRAGDQLRHAMEVLDYIVAPDEIILGGQIPLDLLTRLSAAVAARLPARHSRQARHRTSQLGPLASALGAAFLPIYQTSSPQLDSAGARPRR